MKKLSVIRGIGVNSCPYGLSITEACQDVGDTILQMVPIDEFDDPNVANRLIEANKLLYLSKKNAQRCPFANEIMIKFNKVDCSWGDTAAGEGVHYLTPSPLYPRTFIGDGWANKGQDIYDPRGYFDAPDRGIDVPFGLYSIFSVQSNHDRLLKVAEKYTNKIVNIKDKLAFLRENYFDTLNLIIPSSSVTKLSDEQLEKLLFVIDEWAK